MLFEDKYPDAKIGEEIAPCLIVVEKPRRCFMCDNSTRFVEIDFQTYFCSEECLNKMMDNYIEACCSQPIAEWKANLW